MTIDNPEWIWDGILSRNPQLIRKTWLKLSEDEQKSVLGHLIDMANKPGWMTAQQGSAKVAVNVIAELKADEETTKR
jgi:hypothetical protein